MSENSNRVLKITVKDIEGFPGGLKNVYFVVSVGSTHVRSATPVPSSDHPIFEDTVVIELPPPFSIPGNVVIAFYSLPRNVSPEKKKNKLKAKLTFRKKTADSKDTTREEQPHAPPPQPMANVPNNAFNNPMQSMTGAAATGATAGAGGGAAPDGGSSGGAVPDKFIGVATIPAESFDTLIVTHHWLDITKWSPTKSIFKEKGIVHIATQNCPPVAAPPAPAHENDPVHHHAPQPQPATQQTTQQTTQQATQSQQSQQSQPSQQQHQQHQQDQSHPRRPSDGGGDVLPADQKNKATAASQGKVLPPPPPRTGSLLAVSLAKTPEEIAADEDREDHKKLVFLAKEFKELQTKHRSQQEALRMRKAELEASRSQSDGSAKNLEELRSKNKYLRDKYASLQDKMGKLQQERASITPDTLKKENEMFNFLQRDLTLLNADIEKMSSDIGLMRERITTLSTSAEVLEKRVNDLSEKLQAHQQSAPDAQVRSISEKKTDQWFREHFHLEDDKEVLVAYFRCLNSSLMLGNLYVGNRHVCFDTVLFPGGGSLVVIPVREIKDCRRTATAFVFDNAISITTISGVELRYNGFVQRDEAWRCIAEQAARVNIKFSKS